MDGWIKGKSDTGVERRAKSDRERGSGPAGRTPTSEGSLPSSDARPCVSLRVRVGSLCLSNHPRAFASSERDQEIKKSRDQERASESERERARDQSPFWALRACRGRALTTGGPAEKRYGFSAGRADGHTLGPGSRLQRSARGAFWASSATKFASSGSCAGFRFRRTAIQARDIRLSKRCTYQPSAQKRRAGCAHLYDNRRERHVWSKPAGSALFRGLDLRRTLLFGGRV